MDKAGLPDLGLMDPSIKPLWKDTENFTHRIAGIAVTTRYVPTKDPMQAGWNRKNLINGKDIFIPLTPTNLARIIRQAVCGS